MVRSSTGPFLFPLVAGLEGLVGETLLIPPERSAIVSRVLLLANDQLAGLACEVQHASIKATCCSLHCFVTSLAIPLPLPL